MGASKAGRMDTDVTGTFPHSGNSHTKSCRTRKKQFLYMYLSQLLDQLLPHHFKENPSSSCHTWQGQTEKGTSGCLDYTLRQNPLTCHSLGIDNVCCCLCDSCAHDVAAHGVHAARAQCSLLLAGSEGLNAQIHLHKREAHIKTPCASKTTQNPLLVPQPRSLTKL